MTTVEAVYQDGVFKPVGPVTLPENQRVRLQVEPVEPARPPGEEDWLAALKRRHAVRDARRVSGQNARD